MQALRRAVLRDSVLLRLLPQRGDLHESGWGELLASAFFANLPNQNESMAQRIVVFLEDLKASSGQSTTPAPPAARSTKPPACAISNSSRW